MGKTKELLEAIGLSEEEAREQVIERAASKLARRVHERDMGPLHDAVERIVSDAVNKVADETLRPWAEGEIEAVVMQRTNEWGEKIGDPLSFRQYLVQRAEAYMSEKVDRDGKGSAEQRYSDFRPVQARASYIVDKYLHGEIEKAMTEAIGLANGSLLKGLHETVRIKLNEIGAALKVEIKTGR